MRATVLDLWRSSIDEVSSRRQKQSSFGSCTAGPTSTERGEAFEIRLCRLFIAFRSGHFAEGERRLNSGMPTKQRRGDGL